MHYVCTCTYFNTFFYYKLIHWFPHQSTSTISCIKLINNDNNLLNFDLIHYVLYVTLYLYLFQYIFLCQYIFYVLYVTLYLYLFQYIFLL